MSLFRYLDPRRSFAAKLTVAVLGTVGVLLAVMLLVLQVETRGQIDLVAEEAVVRARQAFEESERMRREQLARRASVFTDNRRTIALLEAAIEAGDTTFLANQISYALQLTRFDSTSLTVLTDAVGSPLLTFMGETPVPGEDPAEVGPMARDLLDRLDTEITTYRLVEGRLYTIRTVVLEMGGGWLAPRRSVSRSGMRTPWRSAGWWVRKSASWRAVDAWRERRWRGRSSPSR